jgi:capsular polysaccharide biosynthesis protein
MLDYRNNLEIDINDMLRHILKGWKLLALLTVIGIVVGGVYGSRQADKAQIEETIAANKTVDDLAGALTTKEKTDVDLAYRAYQQCLELFDQMDGANSSLDEAEKAEFITTAVQVVSMGNSFSADQKLYYKALFEGNGTEGSNAIGDLVLSESANSGNGMVKYVAIGGAIGLFISVFALALGYSMSSKLKTEDELRSAFRIPLIGSIDSESDAGLSQVFSGIVASSIKTGFHKLCVISSSEDEEISKYSDKISNMFEGKDIAVKAVKGVLSEPVAIDTIASSDAVVIVEKVSISAYENIARELELCQNSGTSIIGAVVVK